MVTGAAFPPEAAPRIRRTVAPFSSGTGSDIKRFETILVLCDNDSIAKSAFDRACWLAEANAARVTSVDVVAASPTEFTQAFASLGRPRGGEVAERVFAARRSRL